MLDHPYLDNPLLDMHTVCVAASAHVVSKYFKKIYTVGTILRKRGSGNTS